MFLKRIQLGLVHVAVAMTLVPINSTLNRVMIKELAISATLVAFLASLPYLFSPIQVWIGSYSDRHPVGGLRRTPYVALGLLLCVAGVIVSPQVVFLMAENHWLGICAGLLAFGAWGMGFNLASVSYLAMASEISGEKERGRTIAAMWFMMIIGIILTAIGISRMVDPYSPVAMQSAFWIVGLIALGLGLVALVRLEPRVIDFSGGETGTTWGQMIRTIVGNRQARLFFVYLLLLLAALLGQDILLEPFGGEAFDMPVEATTLITAIWGGATLLALIVAGILEVRVNKRIVAQSGNLGALAGFVLITFSGLTSSRGLFFGGVLLLGAGTGLSTVANLSLMLDMTIAQQVGLFIGAWGMSNALSRLTGALLAGAVRDLVTHLSGSAILGYVSVFAIEAVMLLAAVLMLKYISVTTFKKQAEELTIIEKAAASTDG